MFQTDEQRRLATNLLRYLLWADRMRQQLEYVHARHAQEASERLANNAVIFRPELLDGEMYLCLWFSLLYVVVEGWPRLRIHDVEITRLLRSSYRNMLRDFRNTTFHPEDYDDDRIDAMAAVGEASLDWVRELTGAFKAFFNTHMPITI
jgi:hypothetical protein